MTDRYFARSASDKTDDWPYWFIADSQKSGLNVTVELLPAMRGRMPFLCRRGSTRFAELFNAGHHDRARKLLSRVRSRLVNGAPNGN